MTGYSITEARHHISDIFSRAFHKHEPVVLSRYGREEVVVVSREDWDRLCALEDATDIEAADRAVSEKGKSIPYEQARKELGL